MASHKKGLFVLVVVVLLLWLWSLLLCDRLIMLLVWSVWRSSVLMDLLLCSSCVVCSSYSVTSASLIQAE